jgi:hypothetical protein
MRIDDYVIPHLRPGADNATRSNIGAWADTGIVGQDHRGMHKRRRAPTGSLRGVNQPLARVVVPYGNSKSHILPGKLLSSLLDGSMNKIPTECQSSFFQRIVGITEYLPWVTARTLPISLCVYCFGDPRKLGSQTSGADNQQRRFIPRQ